MDNLRQSDQIALLRPEYWPPGELEDATTVWLESKKLKSLPDNFSIYLNIKWLRLSNNELSDLPDSLSYLRHITRLDLDVNKFDKLPSVIRNFTGLQILLIQKNPMYDLPQFIVELTELKYLQIEINGERSIMRAPVGIKELPCYSNETRYEASGTAMKFTFSGSLKMLELYESHEDAFVEANISFEGEGDTYPGVLKGAQLLLMEKVAQSGYYVVNVDDDIGLVREDYFSYSSKMHPKSKGQPVPLTRMVEQRDCKKNESFGGTSTCLFRKKEALLKYVKGDEKRMILAKLETFIKTEHEFVIKLLGYYISHTICQLFFELPVKSVYDAIVEGNVSLSARYIICAQVASGACYLLREAPLSGYNYMITTRNIALFGTQEAFTAKITGPVSLSDINGVNKDIYNAPEGLSGDSTMFDESGHVYGFGIVMWLLFHSDKLNESHLKREDIVLGDRHPVVIHNIIQSCIDVSERRPTFGALKNVFEAYQSDSADFMTLSVRGKLEWFRKNEFRKRNMEMVLNEAGIEDQPTLDKFSGNAYVDEFKANWERIDWKALRGRRLTLRESTPENLIKELFVQVQQRHTSQINADSTSTIRTNTSTKDDRSPRSIGELSIHSNHSAPSRAALSSQSIERGSIGTGSDSDQLSQTLSSNNTGDLDYVSDNYTSSSRSSSSTLTDSQSRSSKNGAATKKDVLVDSRTSPTLNESTRSQSGSAPAFPDPGCNPRDMDTDALVRYLSTLRLPTPFVNGIRAYDLGGGDILATKENDLLDDPFKMSRLQSIIVMRFVVWLNDVAAKYDAE